MSRTLRGFVAPAGTPLGLWDISNGLLRGSLDRAATGRLEAALAERADRAACRLVSSGRAALTVILRAMKAISRDPQRTQVVVPGYTCYSVAAAVARAGLEPCLCDIETETLGVDPRQLEQLDFTRVLAVVATSLYGVPSNLARMEAIASKHGVQLIDDAAQAMGAAIGTRPVGGFGDAGLFSFDKGKNITTIQGGAILASDSELVNRIASEVRALPAPAIGSTVVTALKIVAYAALLRPMLYGAVRRLPFLGLGRTPYETDYAVAQYPWSLARLAERLHRRLDRLSAKRRENAAAMRAALSTIPGVKLIEGLPDATPVFARYPVLVDASVRDALISRLEAHGIGASASYPHALVDVPEVASRIRAADSNTSVARAVASRIVTLPTHPLCPPGMADTVADTFAAFCD